VERIAKDWYLQGGADESLSLLRRSKRQPKSLVMRKDSPLL
jgi:hypothetical protein